MSTEILICQLQFNKYAIGIYFGGASSTKTGPLSLKYRYYDLKDSGGYIELCIMISMISNHSHNWKTGRQT